MSYFKGKISAFIILQALTLTLLFFATAVFHPVTAITSQSWITYAMWVPSLLVAVLSLALHYMQLYSSFVVYAMTVSIPCGILLGAIK